MTHPRLVFGIVACGIILAAAEPGWALCQNGASAQTVLSGQNLTQIIEASSPYLHAHGECGDLQRPTHDLHEP